MRFKGNGSADNLVVAIVGLGYWGPNLTRVLADRPDVRLKWLCDMDPERLDQFRRRHPASLCTSEVEDVLNDDEVDAVIFATPVFTHYELASASIAAGKHTFVEKPLAPSFDEATDLAERARAEGVTLMCGHTFLYSPPVQEVKRLIDAGDLGDILFVSSSRVNLGLHREDVSVIWDLGPHDFSILLYWLDELPTSVRAVGRDSIVAGVPDVAFVSLAYDSGIVANVELSWLAPSKLRRTVVVGSEKMVVYEDGTSEPVKVFDHGVIFEDPETFGEYHLSYRTGDVLSPKLAAHEPLEREIDDFLGSIRRATEPLSSLSLASDVVMLSEAADASLKADGARIELDSVARPIAVG